MAAPGATAEANAGNASESRARNAAATKLQAIMRGNAERKSLTEPLMVRLGKLLVARGESPEEVLRQWDTDGDGTVAQDEFAKQVRLLGLAASDMELNTLFNELLGSSDSEVDDVDEDRGPARWAPPDGARYNPPTPPKKQVYFKEPTPKRGCCFSLHFPHFDFGCFTFSENGHPQPQPREHVQDEFMLPPGR